MSSTQEKLHEPTLGKMVKDYRKSLGLNQTEFALLFGRTTPTAVSLWESGFREIPGSLCIALIDSAKRERAIEANQKWKQYLLDYHEHHDYSVDPTESPYVDSLEMESDIDKDTARLKQSMGKSYVDETIYPVDAKAAEKWYDGKKKPETVGDDAVWGAE